MQYDSDEERPEDPLPKYKVRYSEIPFKQLKEVIKFTNDILNKGKLDKDSAVEICSRCKSDAHLSKKGDGEWQCIIGTHFGASLTYDTKTLILFDLPDFRKSVMLFKSG